MLATRSGGPAGAQLDLVERQGEVFANGQTGHKRHNFRPCQRLESAVPQPGTGADCTWKHPPFAPRRDSARLTISLPLLRLRSDDQLLALFRAGSDEAFNVLHDRYRQRLFAYVRQMLSAQSRQDAEDVLQDVFVRAFGALRADARPVNVRAWLYRVAHNRCIDHLRRPVPAAGRRVRDVAHAAARPGRGRPAPRGPAAAS